MAGVKAGTAGSLGLQGVTITVTFGMEQGLVKQAARCH